MEIAKKKPAVAGKRTSATWKDDWATAAKATARAAKTAIKPKPKASPGKAAVAGKRKAATWKDDVASAAKAKARAAKTAIQPKPKTSPGLEIGFEV